MAAIKCLVDLLELTVRPKLVHLFLVSLKVSDLFFDLLFHRVFVNLDVESTCKLPNDRLCFGQLTYMTPNEIAQ